MKTPHTFAAIMTFFFAPAAPAFANGAVSEFPAGGVVFKAEPDIAIAREDLEIGLDRIHVHYVFNSSAETPLERTIGFPLAKVPQDDLPDGFEDDDRNYMDFQVSVNGTPLEPKLHEYAWKGDTNITRKLDRLGVPVFAATPSLFERLAQLPPATVAALKAGDLVDTESEGDGWLIPKWQYQAVFEWRQSFAPGKTEVDITYAPLAGASNDYDAYYPGGSLAGKFCLGEATVTALSAYEAPLAGPEPYTVGYILQTAKNWNGPVGEFHLAIADGGSLFAFCPPAGLKKASADGRNWVAKDFVPNSDLEVVFYYLDTAE